MINQKLAEKPEGSEFNYSDIVTSVAKAYGNHVADEVLLAIVGVNSQKSDNNSTDKPKTDNKKGKTKSEKPKAEQVQKVKKKVRRKKAKPTNSAPATPDIENMSARDILKDAFKQGRNKRVK
jgi:hypothetical protein